MLRTVVAREGSTDWVAVATHIAGRTGAQCRHRWKDVLDPAIDKSPWTAEEVPNFEPMVLFFLVVYNFVRTKSYWLIFQSMVPEIGSASRVLFPGEPETSAATGGYTPWIRQWSVHLGLPRT